MCVVEGVGDAEPGSQLFRLSQSSARDRDDVEAVEEAQDGKVTVLGPPPSPDGPTRIGRGVIDVSVIQGVLSAEEGGGTVDHRVQLTAQAGHQ